MNRIKNRRINRIVGMASIIIGLFVFFNTPHDSGYELYFVLPLVWGCLLILKPILNFIDVTCIGSFVLAYTMFIKYSISPLISCIGKYTSWLGTAPGRDNLQKAVLLTIYEMLVLYFVCYICNRKYKAKSFKIENNIAEINDNWGHVSLVIIGAASFVLVPSAFADYRFIFDNTNLSENIFITAAGAGVFKTFFIVGRYSLVILLINSFYKRYKKTPSALYVILSFLVVLLNCIYVQNLSRINILIPLMIGLAICTQFFPRKSDRKSILLLAGTIGVTFLVVLSYLKFFGEGRGDASNMNSIEWWGDTLNMYFTGIKETAIGYKALPYIESVFGWNRFPLFINDFFSNISLLSNLSNIGKCSVVLYNRIYFGANYTGQIPPNSIEGVYYFGSVLAPILPAIFVALAYKFSYLSKLKARIDEKFIYLYAAIWSGLVLMINYNMIVANIVNISLFYLVFVMINKHVKFRSYGGPK